MKYLFPVTPILSVTVKKFCEEVVLGGEQIYLDCLQAQGEALNDCFTIVEKRVKAKGGRIIYGWAVRIAPRMYLEAEFHAVWETTEGNLLDISVKEYQTKRILFLPDPTKKFDGRQVNNKRKPLQENPVIKGFLKTYDDEFEVKNRGMHEFELNEDYKPTPEEIEELELIIERRIRYSIQLDGLFPEIGPYDPCPCGSGKGVKWCCGIKNLKPSFYLY